LALLTVDMSDNTLASVSFINQTARRLLGITATDCDEITQQMKAFFTYNQRDALNFALQVVSVGSTPKYEFRHPPSFLEPVMDLTPVNVRLAYDFDSEVATMLIERIVNDEALARDIRTL
jgi:hypothetical protein